MVRVILAGASIEVTDGVLEALRSGGTLGTRWRHLYTRTIDEDL